MSFLDLLLGKPEKEKPNPSAELEHINQEIYKKSAELTEKNKTLSLLQKISEIIIGSITHQEEVARRVTSVVVSEQDFQIAAIFLSDEENNVLKLISLSESSPEENAKQIIQDKTYASEISLTHIDNLVVQSVIDKSPKVSNTLEGVLLPKDGDEQTAIKSVFIYPLIVRDELIGAMVIGLKEKEEEISEYKHDLLVRLAAVIGIAMDNAFLYNEVQTANVRLKALDKLKDEFVSLASHELRTPMTAVKSYLAMALDKNMGSLNDKQQEYLEHANMAVDRLIKLVNDMLNISRIESGRLKIDVKEVDINQLVEEVKTEVMPRINELGLELIVEHQPNLPHVLADTDKIKEVLINLVGNSMKFTPQGGKITITFVQNGDMIETKVSDTGSGIDAEDIPKLFQKFMMIPGSYTANQPSGTGLGLYISKSIIELHKGKIWATSEGVGKGTQFTFSLKVFNEADLKEFQAKYGNSAMATTGIIHTQV